MGEQKSLRLDSGEFSQKLPAGIVWFSVHAAGYAPALVGPLQLRPGETIDGLKIVLEPGFVARFKLVNDAGEPIAGGEALCHLSDLHGGMNLPIKGDSQGVITVEHASSTEVDVTINANGYQTWSRKRLKLRPAEDVQVRLDRSVSTTGVVRTPEGKPIAEAKIRFALQFGPGAGGGKSAADGEVLATTDNAGRFTLDSLDDGAQYAFVVETPEHGRRPVHAHLRRSDRLAIRLRPRSDDPRSRHGGSGEARAKRGSRS